MDEDLNINSQNQEASQEQAPEAKAPDGFESIRNVAMAGLYEDWFLDYASYVILDRAVPYLTDGLKPVQRRVLHAMFNIEDGRYNKVANIIGQTMQYHPHGDAGIGEALINLGQKNLLIDTQGNWGNIFTGDGAAAARYIEARLSRFALDVVFNPKITEWKLSYDGRKKEPISLPIKFPLLLAQGVEGIAVGLASKILPHNFNELLDASIAYLKGQPFELYPDFPTGGIADVSRYNDGLRGGKVRIRATIRKVDSKTLVINEIPYGRTSSSVIESILKANEKGKIKIKKVDDNTSDHAEIIVTLASGISPDKTIDALYACTDCEVSISTNSCVIDGRFPRLIGVSEILKVSTDNTKSLLEKELQVKLSELNDDWHYSSLEKIFFEEKIYKKLEDDNATWDEVFESIERAFDPFRPLLKKEITREDVQRLCEKPVRKIHRLDIKKLDEHIRDVEKGIAETLYNLDHLVEYTIKWFEHIRGKYGKDFPRRTELRNFDSIEVSKVVLSNEKLYINREEGMVGTSLKKDEYVCDCSDIDDIIVIRKNGTYTIKKVAEKEFLGKGILYVNIFKRNDKRTIYNVVYRDGKTGVVFVKRCAINGVSRDKEYDLTMGTEGSKILYLSANPNGESEILKVFFRPRPKLKSLTMDADLGQIMIKGRSSRGNILSRKPIFKVTLKEKGNSTLGGQQYWYESAIQRLNTEGRGELVDTFDTKDRLLVTTSRGIFRVTACDTSYHLEDDLLLLRKFSESKVFTAIYQDLETGFYYLKRFTFENIDKDTSFLSTDINDRAKLILLCERLRPMFRITFGGNQSTRPALIVDGEDFISVKSFRAKGKRLTNYPIGSIEDISPEDPEPEPEEEETDAPLIDGDDNELSDESGEIQDSEGLTDAEDTDLTDDDVISGEDDFPGDNPLDGNGSQLSLF